MLFHRYLDKYTLFLTLPPPFFEEEGVKISKKGVGGATSFLKSYQSESGGQSENAELVEVMGFFHFSLLTITHSIITIA